jgi:hypothetical protein
MAALFELLRNAAIHPIVKSVAGAAPVTTKIDPGNAWNPAVMFGADQLS